MGLPNPDPDEAAEAAVEETTTLLESVHEVYDVVLTCAETYEWAQPGATGALRLYMLQVLAVAFGYDKITGKSLMELLSNDTTAAVSLLTYILRCRDPDCQFELQELASRCLDGAVEQRYDSGGLSPDVHP